MGSPSLSSSNAADEGRKQPSLSSRTKCHGGTLRRRRTSSAICGSSGNRLLHSSGDVTSSVRSPSQPRSDRFFVTGQYRFDLLARPPVFSTPRHRPVGTNFDFDVHSPPVPFELQPPAHGGHEVRTGNALNHVCRQKLHCPPESRIRNRLGSVRIPAPRKPLQFARPIEGTQELFRQITPGCPNRYSPRRPRKVLPRRSDKSIRQRVRNPQCPGRRQPTRHRILGQRALTDVRHVNQTGHPLSPRRVAWRRWSDPRTRALPTLAPDRRTRKRPRCRLRSGLPAP